MKKRYKFLKIMLIFIVVFMLLSWVIPAGVVTDGKYTSSGISAFGLFDILLVPFKFFDWEVMTKYLYTDGTLMIASYSSVIAAIISIGIFYGVLLSTGIYTKLIDILVDKIGKRRQLFIVSISTIIALISSLTGLNILIFMFVPFLVTLLCKLGYSRLNVMLATIGAMIVGNIGSIYAPSINGINSIIMENSIKDGIEVRLVLFIISLIILNTYLILTSKRVKHKEIPLYEENDSERSIIPVISIVSIFTIILLVFMYNWYYTFDARGLTDMYESMMNTSVGGYKVFKNIFGVMEPFGYWTGFSMAGTLVLMSIVIAISYRVSFSKFVDGMKNGISKMLPVIGYMLLAFVPMVVLATNQESFLYTIMNFVVDKMNGLVILPISIIGMIFSIFNVDYFALVSYSSVIASSHNITDTVLIGHILQVVNGVVSLLTPASIFLVAGLSYLKIPYSKWLKYIWKLVLILLIVSMLILFIVSKI